MASGGSSQPAPGITPELQALIANLIDHAVTRIEQSVDQRINQRLNKNTNQGIPRPEPPLTRDPPDQYSYPDRDREVGRPRWTKASEIGYFYPDMPQSWGSGPSVTKDDKMYYREVYSFTKRLRAISTAATRNVTLIIDTCLRGEAEGWWNSELSNVNRIGLTHSNVDEWCKELEKRFRPPPSEALLALQNMRYTVSDARNRRSPTAYVTEMIEAARACGIGTSDYYLVLQVWYYIDPELRFTIREPKPDTKIEDIMETERNANELVR